MGDWLKDRPVIQMILNTFLSLLVLLFMFWLTGMSESNASVEKEIETLKLEKAPYTYVDDKVKESEGKIEAKDAEQDIKMETIRTETRTDLKEINNKLDRLIEFQMKK